MKCSITKVATHRMTISVDTLRKSLQVPEDAAFSASVVPSDQDGERPTLILVHIEWSRGLGFEQVDWPLPVSNHPIFERDCSTTSSTGRNLKIETNHKRECHLRHL